MSRPGTAVRLLLTARIGGFFPKKTNDADTSLGDSALPGMAAEEMMVLVKRFRPNTGNWRNARSPL